VKKEKANPTPKEEEQEYLNPEYPHPIKVELARTKEREKVYRYIQ